MLCGMRRDSSGQVRRRLWRVNGRRIGGIVIQEIVCCSDPVSLPFIQVPSIVTVDNQALFVLEARSKQLPKRFILCTKSLCCVDGYKSTGKSDANMEAGKVDSVAIAC